MSNETSKSNLNNKRTNNNSNKVPKVSEIPEDKSSSMPYTDPPEASPEEIKTDEAVDDISRSEGDELLAIEDAKHSTEPGPHKSWLSVFKKKKIIIPVLILLALILIAAIPQSRYKVFGLFWQQNYKLIISDSQTGKPVSDATVSLDGKTTITNNQGWAQLKVAVGHHAISVSKKYYKTLNEHVLVALRVRGITSYTLQATGRQVPIKVVNKITDLPINNAVINLAGTQSRTDKNGQTTMVLPADQSSIKGTITANSYNSNSVTVQITVKQVAANTFALIPYGKIYFLSNASGNIDVVKTNLDGSDRQTVLPGTGNEDPNNTALLATRDWSYLALLAQRSVSDAELYLITTSNDKLSVIDNSNASFTPIGWYNHYFLYDAISNSIPVSRTGHEELKSYNANTGQTSILDQNQAQTKNGLNFFDVFSSFNIIDNELSYTTQWYASDNTSQADFTNQQDSLMSVLPSGGNKQTRKSFLASQISYLDTRLYDPNNAYLAVYSPSGNTKYYNFDGSSVTTAAITNSTYNKLYPTYLLSPSGSQTFWDEPRDGKNTLFIGNEDADNAKQIASLSDYQPYGWYSDSYILLSKDDSSELYIATPQGLANNAQPVKITDYYQPVQSFAAYGGGNGEL